jgi:hypothetical protein
MESGSPLHKSKTGASGMVPYRGVTDLSRLPLLPFERELVATLGCTEAEYRAFTVEVMKRSRVRPAEYDHIPDINALPAVFAAGALTTFGTIAVNLAIGLALSALSYLLTPKPKQQGQTTSRQLASRTGADRFSATSGFDTQAELANFGDPIPIIFGQYNSTLGTGGILAAPSLVWSRAFSYGSQQGVKLMFVVGEQGAGANGLSIPSLNGIFLGNTALDVIHEHNFAFYWKRDTNANFRIREENLRYGSSGTESSGDPETNNDVFLCPTLQGQSEPGFCQAYTPTANVQFGVYSGIHNGTDYRVDWKLVSIPHIPGEGDRYKDDPKNQRLKERIKIAGDYGIAEGNVLAIRAEGQKGTGRGYGRRMGITSLNSVAVTSGETEIRQAAIGDTAVFTIASGELPENLYYVYVTDSEVIKGTKVDDINSEITAGRRRADEMLQLGETVMIGRTVWVVQKRALPEWEEGTTQSIDLRCVEIFGTGISASIGLVSEKMITSGVYSDDNGITDAGDGLGLHAGAGFYPVLRVAFGVIRNSRDCEVTEIGLRSQVWNRASGLCNFQGLPSVGAFITAEQDGVGIQSGTSNMYLKRTSVWTIFLRPSGTNSDGIEYAWKPLGEQFCITGESPQDQFNYIRIAHPERGRYEFKMVPKSGADVARHSDASAEFMRLDAKTRQPISTSHETSYGTFVISSMGQLVTKSSVLFNKELGSEASTETSQVTVTGPPLLGVNTYMPAVQQTGAAATAVSFVDSAGVTRWLPVNVSRGRDSATTWELFGDAKQMGAEASAEKTVLISGFSSFTFITLRFSGIVDRLFPSDHPYYPNALAWTLRSVTVVGSYPSGISLGQDISVDIPVSGGNPRAGMLPGGVTTVGVIVRVTKTTGVQPVGRQAAYGFAIFGNPASYTVGERQTTSRTFSQGFGASIKQMAVLVSAVPSALTTEQRNSFPFATAIWTDFKYTFSTSTKDWDVGDLVSDTVSIIGTNPFYRTGEGGVQLVVQEIGKDFAPTVYFAARNFESNSQVNDVSFYSSLAKSNESGPEHEIVYVNEMVSNLEPPEYTNLTTAGLALKASRNFTSLDQLRVWLAEGISVTKFAADAPAPIGPSNRFTDLVYYLLTDKVAGAGSVVSPELIDTTKFPATSQFLKQNKLFFDGAIAQPTNIRQFISDTAPFFLCAFIISNGKFSIIPAVPTESHSGAISKQPVKIQQLFTSGNIIEDSFTVEYLSTEERKNFQAVIRYRSAKRNQLPEERTLVVRWADLPETASIETFDMTQYCTSSDHAALVAKYFLSLRRRVTHTVKFRTTPYGISLAPGNYIRVVTQATPYSVANNGVVDGSGNITSVTPLADGVYNVSYWNSSFDDLKTENMTVASGKAVEPKFANSIFAVVDATVSSGTYMVEQLSLSEEGLVDIVAVQFPTTDTFNSLIALDLLNDSAFTFEGDYAVS